VAKYAQACNLFATPELPHKLDVLRRHCDDVGRDYDEIEKTVMGPLDPGADGEKVDALLDQIEQMGKLGITHYHGSVPEVASMTRLELLGDRVLPAVADL
jgi:alkanesulfonate monooxygenase